MLIERLWYVLHTKTTELKDYIGKLRLTIMAWINMMFNKYTSCIKMMNSDLCYRKIDRLVERLIARWKVCDSNRKYETIRVKNSNREDDEC